MNQCQRKFIVRSAQISKSKIFSQVLAERHAERILNRPRSPSSLTTFTYGTCGCTLLQCLAKPGLRETGREIADRALP